MIDLLCAVGLDLALGDPAWLPHPVRLMGTMITHEERWVRRFARGNKGLMLGGFCIVLLNLLLAFGIPALLLLFLRPYPLLSHLVNIYLLSTCFAARCLRDEALKVHYALEQGLTEARRQLSRIVGRETAHLNESEILRATVETVAENTADGIIAPYSTYDDWRCAACAMAYKMVNTVDSMLGIYE